MMCMKPCEVICPPKKAVMTFRVRMKEKNFARKKTRPKFSTVQKIRVTKPNKACNKC